MNLPTLNPEPPVAPVKAVMDQDEIAALFGVCRKTIFNWMQTGVLPYQIKGDKTVRFDMVEVFRKGRSEQINSAA